MRISLITETFPPEVNGVAMTLHRLVSGLMANGHQVDVTRPRQNKRDRPGANDCPETLVRGLPIPGYPELRFGLPAGRMLDRRWRRNRPDVVHVATEGPLGWSAVRAALRLGIPVSSSFHTNFHSYTAHYRFGLLRRIAFGYLRALHNRTRRTFVPSQTMVRSLDQAGFANLRVLGRGVDTGLFDPQRRSQALRHEWGAQERTPVAIYVGRLAPEKNIPLVVAAYEAMREAEPETILVLVGDGPEAAALRRRFPAAHFAGLRRGEDLAAHYASGDVFLFPSITETFGNVVTEALASGLIVLAYDYAAAHEHVVHRVNGYTAPLSDAGAFVDTARELVRADRDWGDVRRAARETSLSLTWSAIVGEFERELSLLLESPST